MASGYFGAVLRPAYTAASPVRWLMNPTLYTLGAAWASGGAISWAAAMDKITAAASNTQVLDLIVSSFENEKRIPQVYQKWSAINVVARLKKT
jgi:hypothetical protein